jgi:methylated-DNA-[protein]-cysteine S-methyltransferase
MEENNKVYWNSFHHNDWTLYVAATNKGLCYVTLPNETFDTLAKYMEKRLRKVALEHNPTFVTPYVNELQEYLTGKRKQFSIALDFAGTPFQVSVWQALLKIPYGQSLSYSDIANLIGKPSAVRAVGAAVGANPIPFVIPCHRVLGKHGTLTGYRGGLKVKSALLQLEGITSGIR